MSDEVIQQWLVEAETRVQKLIKQASFVDKSGQLDRMFWAQLVNTRKGRLHEEGQLHIIRGRWAFDERWGRHLMTFGEQSESLCGITAGRYSWMQVHEAYIQEFCPRCEYMLEHLPDDLLLPTHHIAVLGDLPYIARKGLT
jgi:hypothetical protein